jgi:Protein of unknown function (DUF3997)
MKFFIRLVRNFIFFIIFFLLEKCGYRNDGNIESLGSGYSIYISSHSKDILGKKDILLVSGIKDYAIDDSFITAFRNLNQISHSLDSTDLKWEKQNLGDSLEFWIINKKNDSLYGPLNRSEFDDLKNRFKFSSDLKLNVDNPRF